MREIKEITDELLEELRNEPLVRNVRTGEVFKVTAVPQPPGETVAPAVAEEGADYPEPRP